MPTLTANHLSQRFDAANWFEIAATDLARATSFYERLLGKELIVGDYAEPMALFSSSAKGVGGAIVCRPHQKPSTEGTLVYLNTDGVLADAIARVAGLGGSVLVPVTEVPGGFGFFACIRDSEGNHVGLHQH